MAHPLNRARYCEGEERVCEGYGILQPRVGASLPGTAQSRYARIFGGEAGIDPYTRAVSDVYQDLFGEGSFIGKGIYDVDAFEHALKGRFPENRILSHDLVEGCYARAGLLTDVELYEEYPARYSADVKPPPPLDSRRLADCCAGSCRAFRAPQAALRNAICGALPLENLRQPAPQPGARPPPRSCSSAWCRSCPARLVDLATVGAIFIPAPSFSCLFGAFRQPRDILWSQHLDSTISCARQPPPLADRLQASPAFPTKRTSAWMRFCARSGAWPSRRRLLEWAPSEASHGHDDASATNPGSAMWIGPAIAIGALLVYLMATRPTGLLPAALPSGHCGCCRPSSRGGWASPSCAHRATSRRSNCSSSASCPQDLGIL